MSVLYSHTKYIICVFFTSVSGIDDHGSQEAMHVEKNYVNAKDA